MPILTEKKTWQRPKDALSTTRSLSSISSQPRPTMPKISSYAPVQMHSLGAHERRLIAAAAMVDPRTVRKWAVGIPILPMCRTRIESAARDLGLLRLTR